MALLPTQQASPLSAKKLLVQTIKYKLVRWPPPIRPHTPTMPDPAPGFPSSARHAFRILQNAHPPNSSPVLSPQNSLTDSLQPIRVHQHPPSSKKLLETPHTTVHSAGTWTETPALYHVPSPQPYTIWQINGPFEPVSQVEMIDIGEGCLVPKRDIAILQSIVHFSTTKPSRPARVGKLSLLQKSCLKLDDLDVPHAQQNCPFPLAFANSCLILASQLSHDFKTVEEPDLSDTDIPDGDMASVSSVPSPETILESRSVSSESWVGEVMAPAKSVREHEDAKSVQNKAHQENVSSSSFELVESDMRKDLGSNDGLVGLKPVEAVYGCLDDKMSHRIRDLKQYCHRLLAERKKLRRENLNLRYRISEIRLLQGRENMHEEATGEGSYIGDSFEIAKSKLEIQQQARIIASQLENERLLDVILKLSAELDQEPEVSSMARELLATKMELSQEKVERQKLQRIVGELTSKKRGFFSSNYLTKTKSESIEAWIHEAGKARHVEL